MSNPQMAYADPALATDPHLDGPMCRGPAPPAHLLSQQLQSDELRRAGQQIIRSDDPALDGRPAADVAAEVRARMGRYRALVPQSIEDAVAAKQQEARWYARLGLVGGFIDLLNDEERTDPGRWDAVVVEWRTAAGEIERALTVVADPAAVVEGGRSSERALQQVDRALRYDRWARRAFEKHLTGFTDSAGDVLLVSTVVRDLSFAAAVGLAVTAMAPVVYAGAAAAAGGVGLSGGAATAAAHLATGATMGAIGGAYQATTRGSAVALVEGCALLDALLDEETTWQEAINAFDWDRAADEGWQGFKRGFLDGVLAYAGNGLEKVIARGAGRVLEGALGEAGRATLSRLLGRGVERAAASGATGGVLGALDNGLRVALEGGSLDAIAEAAEAGFVMGAVVGAGVGAVSHLTAKRTGPAPVADVRAEAAELTRLLRDDPAAFAERFNALVAEMSDAQRAAFGRELRGRRFVDRIHYEAAVDNVAAGYTTARPEHLYGRDAFDDWSRAADVLDAHARSGAPLTPAEVDAAHAAAMGRLDPDGAGLRREIDVAASGGLGDGRLWTALSPEQAAAIDHNPHLRLLRRGEANDALTAAQRQARFETAIIVYPGADDVQGALDDFFVWYARNRGAGDPVAFAAEAQQRLVSIHPFADGNGRVSRLVMDHALQGEGLPPALLRDPDLDYMVSAAAWADEVRGGVMETWRVAARHVDRFNAAVRTGDPEHIAARWMLVLGLGDDPGGVAAALYGDG